MRSLLKKRRTFCQSRALGQASRRRVPCAHQPRTQNPRPRTQCPPTQDPGPSDPGLRIRTQNPEPRIQDSEPRILGRGCSTLTLPSPRDPQFSDCIHLGRPRALQRRIQKSIKFRLRFLINFGTQKAPKSTPKSIKNRSKNRSCIQGRFYIEF